ncbi:hypothetical protein BGZ95_003217 [Linnemannia exigua]|uniref:Uncharacterized protein n=1 Tax=Linnemannia exigua TaxID=604196 RepID=A0AAD4DJS9_9FUNG|nr:hypothetical protein BGZ95_003217 [Linnemannia exigua]
MYEVDPNNHEELEGALPPVYVKPSKSRPAEASIYRQHSNIKFRLPDIFGPKTVDDFQKDVAAAIARQDSELQEDLTPNLMQAPHAWQLRSSHILVHLNRNISNINGQLEESAKNIKWQADELAALAHCSIYQAPDNRLHCKNLQNNRFLTHPKTLRNSLNNNISIKNTSTWRTSTSSNDGKNPRSICQPTSFELQGPKPVHPLTTTSDYQPPGRTYLGLSSLPPTVSASIALELADVWVTI